MGLEMILLVLLLIVVALVAPWLGFRRGQSAAKSQAEEAVANERKLAEVRETSLREQLDKAREEIAALRPKESELSAVKQQLEDEQKKYAQMKADLDAAFKGAAADALRANTQSFLALAKQELGGQNATAEQTLAKKEEAIRVLLDPLKETLGKLDIQTREMEKAREGAYGKVESMISDIKEAIPKSVDALKNETAQLIAALRAPKTRGNWGELQLRRCVEFAGMVQYCSFSEQVTARDQEDKMLRPDMTIQLPNGRAIVVDAKTPLDAFLTEAEGADLSMQAMRFAAHAERVKAHLRDLSSKTYWKQFDHTPEFVVCFLPSEALFSAALEADPSLIEFGSQANVVMATPTTLIALLKAVAYGWQQSQITQNAKAIQEAGRDLYSKLVNAHDYFDKLGTALGNAVGHYNKFVGAVEGRGGAFFHARKLGSLVHESEELEAIESLPAEPRQLMSDDWSASSTLALADEAEEAQDAPN